VKDVRVAEPVHDDTQQSFFLAETLKYLFLIFRWAASCVCCRRLGERGNAFPT
jgi:hypothetical protein